MSAATRSESLFLANVTCVPFLILERLADRMMWLSLCVLWSEQSVGAVFCDGVSAPVPLLRLAGPVR